MTIEQRGMWEDSGFGWDTHVHEEGSQRYCFGSGGGGTNTVTQVQIPQWAQDAGFDNYQRAVNSADMPYQQYGGQRVAGLNAYNQDVANRVGAMQGQGQAYTNNALAMTQAAGSYQPQQVGTQFAAPQVNGQAVGAMNRDAYMNPYLSAVRDTGLAALEQSRLRSINQVGDQAQSAGAFGGSRHGVMEGTANAQAAMAAGQLASQIGAQGFDAASGLMTTDANRALAAQQGNQSAAMQAQQLGLSAQTTNANLGLSGAQLGLAAANQYGNLANQGQAMTARELSLQDVVGQQFRGVEQANLDQNYQNWLDAYNHNSGLTGLGIRESALGMAPYGQTTSSQTSTTGGGLNAGTAIGGAMAGATIASALSDPKMKKDMEKIGEDPSGLDIFAFRYKTDPDNSAKVVGLNAADVEKKMPQAVVKYPDGKGGSVRGILFDALPTESAKALAAGKAPPPATMKKRRAA